MRKGISSSQQGTLSREVMAGKNKALQGHARKGRGTWPGMLRGWRTSPRRMKKKKIRQGFASRRKGTLSGEVTVGHKRVRQRHACRGQGTCPGMQRGRQTIPRRMKKMKMRQGIASSRRGTLSVEVTARQKRAWRGHTRREKGTWPGMRREK